MKTLTGRRYRFGKAQGFTYSIFRFPDVLLEHVDEVAQYGMKYICYSFDLSRILFSGMELSHIYSEWLAI